MIFHVCFVVGIESNEKTFQTDQKIPITKIIIIVYFIDCFLIFSFLQKQKTI